MSFPSKSKANQGVALVLVLGCLVLLSILIVAFLASVKTEMTSSSGYASSTDVKQRSQTAVNMVIAQIQEATSGTDTAWSSQPGLIRTFDGSGHIAQAFKLYSSAEMVAGNTFDPNAATDIPADWKSRPGEYTDLNQPVLVPDPNGSISRDGLPYTPNFPILDPGALGTVKGFSLNGNSTTPPNYAVIDPITENPAAMPVQWLYILQDGSVRAMDPSTKTVPGATGENPIVSRVAFWTDDETCKVNINTAAGDEWNNTTDPGSFTDPPRTRTEFDESIMRLRQPVSHEYQRYPGHPGTTYLSAIFPNLTRNQIADVVPRIAYGGSRGGTVATAASGTSATALPFSDGLPLYASVDELRFVRSLSQRTTQDSLFTPRQIEQAKFFLTAQSRAPEINLFNRPRVSVWPVPADPAKRTSFDKTIAFCATVAGKAFYFVRNNPNSPTSDYTDQVRNQELYSYLRGLMALKVPGFGGDFLAKYPTPESDQILTEIFDYIRSSINLLDTTVGATPYAGQIFNGDLRGAPSGMGHVVPIQIGDTRGFGRSVSLYCPILLLTALRAEVIPHGAVDSNGNGLLEGTSEGAQKAEIRTKEVQAMFLMDTFSPSQGPVRFVPNLVFKVTGLERLALDGVPMGFPAEAEVNLNRYATNHEYAWGGYINHAAFFFDRTLGASAKTLSQYQLFSSPLGIDKEYKKGSLSVTGGDQIFLEVYARDTDGTVSSNYIQRIHLNFPAVTVPVPTVRETYKQSYTTSKNPTIKSPPSTYADAIAGSIDTVDSPGLVNRQYNSANKEFQTIYQASRSLVPANGDMRLIMATKDVPDSAFIRGRGYDSPTDGDYAKLWKVAEGEENSGGMVGVGPTTAIGGLHMTTSGKLVSGVTYDQHLGSSPVKGNDYGPSVSSSVNGAYLIGSDGNPHPGDWDTGTGPAYDGPYINKADEGETGADAYTSYTARVSVASLFSPNRQVPSPVVFGSLSTGVKRNRPWQTLLFCPNPPAKQQHPGLLSPPDHLLLDLFWMPVVEPYAISEPFSTAGKINLNYQIVPFTNIERSTGLQAVLRSTRITAIPNADGIRYKSSNPPISELYRHLIDIPKTLEGFQERFTANKPFRSASEICEMFLIPQGKGATMQNIASWWNDYGLTGDNLRELPYSHLYSRLTTKSNTYTVHVRAQTLKKVDRDNPGKWIEGRDKILGEHRGSYTIERYLDPNLETYDESQPLTGYKFRTLSTKHFTP